MKLLVALMVIGVSCLSTVRAEELKYQTPVTLKGTVTILYDMAFVDSDMGPVKDPTGIKVKFPDPSKANLQKPSRHLILTLNQPISVAAGAHDGLHPAIKSATEIDLGGVGKDISDGTSVVVEGKLLHAHTVHHLRDLVMTVSSIRTTPKAEQGAAANP
jgi:hypothetical protein